MVKKENRLGIVQKDYPALGWRAGDDHLHLCYHLHKSEKKVAWAGNEKPILAAWADITHTTF